MASQTVSRSGVVFDNQLRTRTAGLRSMSVEMRCGVFRHYPFNNLQGIENVGAGEGIRTLDPDLGKVVLYH